MRNLVIAVVFGVLSTSSVAWADHTLPSGSLARLHRNVYELQRAVQYSTLSYRVKDTVYRFASDVSRFLGCVQQGLDERENTSRDHDLIPSFCEYALDRVHSSWYFVDRYLYDTNYDYPQVYYRYLNVKRDIRALPH